MLHIKSDTMMILSTSLTSLCMPLIDLAQYKNVVKELLTHMSESEYRLEYSRYVRENKFGEAAILKQAWFELNGHKIPALLK